MKTTLNRVHSCDDLIKITVKGFSPVFVYQRLQPSSYITQRVHWFNNVCSLFSHSMKVRRCWCLPRSCTDLCGTVFFPSLSLSSLFSLTFSSLSHTHSWTYDITNRQSEGHGKKWSNSKGWRRASGRGEEAKMHPFGTSLMGC